MARKKQQQKKRLKKYKGKYVTADRLDMSKGGRVKAAVGGMQNRRLGDGLGPLKPNENEPIATTGQEVFYRKPIQQEPQKPVQPGIPVTGGGNLGSGKMPRADLPTGPAKTPVNTGRPIQRGDVGGITAQPEGKLKQVDSSGNILKDTLIGRQPGETAEQYRARTAGQFTPSNTQQTFKSREEAGAAAAGLTLEEYRALQEEQNLKNLQTNDVARTSQAFQRSPTTGKGSDQMFIGREGEVRPAMSVTDARDVGRGYEPPYRPPGTPPYTPPGTPPVTPPGTPPVTPPGETPITGTPEQLEAERGKRVIQTGRTAEQIAAGEIPEGIVPTAEAEKISMEGTEAEAVEFKPTEQVTAETLAQQTPEQVAAMEAVAAQTPEEIQAAQMEAEQIAKTPEIEVTKGEVVEDALAKAAKVDRVAPIEGVEVEIPEGALTERVIGTLSEGAKATAAINAGTSLSRITRAKKQLSRAGLSDEDIAEIGNDPEALEDRLADFSEEQRGIIEGLPEEALVSTQINGLLEGIENGEIPVWARPAVAQVEQMLAKRGMSASTVGRDALLNTIIQSAMPIAQSNAQAIQSSVAQQRDIEFKESEANAQRVQQTALTNAQNVFQMDMAQFSSDQQIALSNSRFLQTVGLTEANNEQQATIQNAMLMSQANLTEAGFNQQAQIQNAQAFLQMDMQNLTNEQQSNVLKAQQEQQRLLSNQASENAARQFNSASENQTQQFMASLSTQVEQFNVTQMNAAEQINTQSQNAAFARDANRTADINKANAAILNQVSQFNAQMDFNRQQWNAANQQAIINSNITWRRQSNTANTAAQNAVNQQNVQNAFGLTSSAQSFLWQELRDQADYDFRFAENDANRKLQAMIAAAGSEGDAAKNWSTNFRNASSTIDSIFG